VTSWKPKSKRQLGGLRHRWMNKVYKDLEYLGMLGILNGEYLATVRVGWR